MTITEPRSGLPLVAIVGRPNVGKSSLANRMLGRREAIVEATPGVTRDRRSFEAEWAGRRFELIDTGGIELRPRGLEAQVREQAELAIAAADVIVLVVDATTGPTQEDAAIASRLRRSEVPVIVAANKVDDATGEPEAASFYRLGLGDPVAVSALHGRGSGDFLDAVVARLPRVDSVVDAAWGSVAIVGRPNVGKSSILNSLIGEGRAIVDVRPGTTRDPVAAQLVLPEGRTLEVVDTAGMRRGVQINDPLEYYSWLRSRRTLERVDAALLVIDAAEGVTGHDQRLAEAVIETGRACVIALNKWDLSVAEATDRARLEDDIEVRLRFMPWATRVRTSALTGRGMRRVVPSIEAAVRSHRRRVSTAQINDIVQRAQAERPHARSGGRSVRILYAVQAEVAPPTVLLFSTARPTEAYLRYLEHRLRAEEPWEGTPVRVQYRARTRA
jgi:GTP-binding protein